MSHKTSQKNKRKERTIAPFFLAVSWYLCNTFLTHGVSPVLYLCQTWSVRNIEYREEDKHVNIMSAILSTSLNNRRRI